MKPPPLISVALYLLACALPALEFRKSTGVPDIMFGLRALAVGWSGLFAGVFAWFANPVWGIGLLMAFLRKPGWCLAASAVSLGIALTTFALVGRELPADEGNVTRTTVVRLLPGFYTWIASIAVLPLLAWLGREK